MMNATGGSARLKRMAMASAALATAAAAHGQFVIYVDDDAAANGDGLTWETALNDLQTAFFLARIVPLNIEIQIGAGLYLPSQSGDRAASFDLDRSSVQSTITLTIKGGFRGLGGGGDPNERDLDVFRTVLSGDLDGDDQSGFVNYDDNSLHVMMMTRANVRKSTWLDGLVIQGGASGSDGGGARFELSDEVSLRLSNCIFTKNEAVLGGAASASGEVEFSNCLFVENRARIGGAIYSTVGDRQAFINCSFAENEALWGTALHSDAGSGRVTVSNCILVGPSENTLIDGSLDLFYSCLSEFYPGYGNIVADPGFVDPQNGDYRLAAGSPCIDSADTKFMPRDLYVDLGGNVRLFDDPVSPNVTSGFGVVVDMGAFEYQGCDIDFNGDGQANTIDLLTLLNLLNDGCP